MKIIPKICITAIVLGLIVLVLSGCVTTKQRNRILATCPQTTVATLETVTTTLHDTITLPADSALYKALFECQNGIPVLTNEYIVSGTDVSIFGQYQPADSISSAKYSLIVKSVVKEKPVTVPKTVTTQHSTYVKDAKQACPPCKHWPWYYWLLIGFAIRSLWPLIKWALGLIPVVGRFIK